LRIDGLTKELRHRLALAEERLADLKAVLEDMRAQRDAWQTMAQAHTTSASVLNLEVVLAARNGVTSKRFRLNLRAPGTPKVSRGLSGRPESGRSIFRCHSNGRLDVRQTAARSSSEYRGGRSLLIRELANSQPIMATKGQVPADELAAYALKEFSNGFLSVFGLS
jgi:hypothetical protein